MYMGHENVGSSPGEAIRIGSFLQYLEDNVSIQTTMNISHSILTNLCSCYISDRPFSCMQKVLHDLFGLDIVPYQSVQTAESRNGTE